MKRGSLTLFDPEGQRKYLNVREREYFLRGVPACFDDPLDRAFCFMLFLTGCRISEALELTANRVDYSEGTVTLRTLKTRGDRDYRVIPVPRWFMDMLSEILIDRHDFEGRIWTFSRMTGYRRIYKVMEHVGIRRPRSSPKALRHGFAVACVSNGVLLPRLMRWMGHSSLETTEIYLGLTGEEDRKEMEKVWAKDKKPC